VLDNRLYSTERLSEHLIKSYEKGKITEEFALEIANIRNATGKGFNIQSKINTTDSGSVKQSV
jgi:hypothetical protein